MPENITQLMSKTVIALFRSNGRLLEWGDALTAPFGLTSARWQMLGAVAMSTPALTAPQLAERMGVSRQGAQKQLNLLVADGLLSKMANPAHRRSPYYQLTEQGKTVFEQIHHLWETHAEVTGAKIAKSDLEITCRVLNQLSTLHVMLALQGETNEA